MQKWEHAWFYDSENVLFSHRELAWNPSGQMRQNKTKGEPFVYALRLLGDEGWECVGYATNLESPRAVFKRPLE